MRDRFVNKHADSPLDTNERLKYKAFDVIRESLRQQLQPGEFVEPTASTADAINAL